jgi:hypothetical protein
MGCTIWTFWHNLAPVCLMEKRLFIDIHRILTFYSTGTVTFRLHLEHFFLDTPVPIVPLPWHSGQVTSQSQPRS